MERAPITYVRHAMAVVDETVHPTEWSLDDDGRAAAVTLAARLEGADQIGALVTSTEAKALGTAAAIGTQWGLEIVEDDRLREAQRPWIGPGYRAMAHAYLRGQDHEGWEPHTAVAARVTAAVDDALAAAAGRPIVVVSHGLALSIHLRDRLGPEFDAETFWSRLGFPDAWVLDASDLLHRPGPPASYS